MTTNERATTADPVPEGEAIETFTREHALGFVRDEACRRDLIHPHHYTAATPARIKDSCDVAQQLLVAHLALRRRRGRGGRRQHAAAIDAVLSETNDASLVLAMAWLEASFGLLPASWPRHGD